MSAATLHSAVSNEGNPLVLDVNRLSFYLRNTWILKLLDLVHLSYITRREVASCNFHLNKRADVLIQFLQQLKSDELRSQDLNNQLKFINAQIDTLSFIRGEVEKILFFKRHSLLGDFENTHHLVTKMLETFYSILRIYKKANKKTPATSSQMAKDIAAHSMSTLSKLINGN